MSTDSKSHIKIKKSTLVLLIILLPIIPIVFKYGPIMYTAKRNHNSTIANVRYAVKHHRLDEFFENTPNNADHTIVRKESEIPTDKPYMLVMYIQNCPLCEVSLPLIEDHVDNIIYDHNLTESPVMYLDMQSKLGEKYITKYDIQKPTALILESHDDPLIVYSGEKDESGAYIPTAGNIDLIFKQLSYELSEN